MNTKADRAEVMLSHGTWLDLGQVAKATKRPTHPIVSVHIAELPVRVREAHSLVFFTELYQHPALFSLFFIQLGVEWKAVQLLVFHCKQREPHPAQSKPDPISPGALYLGWGTPTGQPSSLTPGHPKEHPIPVGRATHLPAMTWDKRTQLWESFFPFRNKAFSISWIFAFFSCFWRLIYFLDHITYEA